MNIKHLSEIKSFEAGDKTILKEVLHPKNDPVDLPYSLAHAFIPVGEKSLPHQLLKSEELYIILEGEGIIYIDGESQKLEKDSFILVPRGATQFVENTGDIPLSFYCVVSPPWAEEEEKIL